MRIDPELFIEFSRLKLAADGSDSYINGAVECGRESYDPFWYAGVFTTFYAPPTHDAVVARWDMHDALERPHEVERWAAEHWQELPMSGARRTGAFTPAKVRAALHGWASFIETTRWNLGGTFDEAFTEFLRHVPYHGRYTGLKLYETVRRLGAPLPIVDNIVPRGGRTPRKGLGMMFDHDHRSDNAETLKQANELADALRREIPTTWFNVEMLLCNFSKAVKGSYYPGHALDRDLSRILKVQAAFGQMATQALRASRERLYRPECLGELGGWQDRRRDCERCYPDHGYLWSDVLYDYALTADLSAPCPRMTVDLRPVIGFGEEDV